MLHFEALHYLRQLVNRLCLPIVRPEDRENHHLPMTVTAKMKMMVKVKAKGKATNVQKSSAT